MRDRKLVAVALASLWLAGPAPAQMFDAGNQAMIMHQGDLLEQQTAPGGGGGSAGGSRKAPKGASAPASTLLAACQARARAQLRPQYQKRLEAQGKAAADAWLKQAATAAGRWAGERAKAGQPC